MTGDQIDTLERKIRDLLDRERRARWMEALRDSWVVLRDDMNFREFTEGPDATDDHRERVWTLLTFLAEDAPRQLKKLESVISSRTKK